MVSSRVWTVSGRIRTRRYYRRPASELRCRVTTAAKIAPSAQMIAPTIVAVAVRKPLTSEASSVCLPVSGVVAVAVGEAVGVGEAREGGPLGRGVVAVAGASSLDGN